MPDLPLLIVGCTVWVYWACVVGLIVLQRRRQRRAGGLPADPLERRLWLVWVPIIVAWNTLPGVALRKDDCPWALPDVATTPIAMGVRWLAAALALACLLVTMRCWYLMGRNWAIGVVPDQPATLVTTGLYRFVRHPIYALSVALITLTAIVLPTLPMIAVAVTHITLMHLKARNEERFLTSVHGEAYRTYMQRTGRFVPRLRG